MTEQTNEALKKLAGEDFCYLTTTGRVTGNPHEIEIWFGIANGVLYILSGNREKSDWVANLIKQPNVAVRIGGTTYNATARVLAPDTEEDAMARRLLVDRYQTSPTRTSSGDLGPWGRSSLPVAFELQET